MKRRLPRPAHRWIEAKADLGGAWPRTVADLTRMLGQPHSGPRRFTVVRRPEPGSGLDAA